MATRSRRPRRSTSTASSTPSRRAPTLPRSPSTGATAAHLGGNRPIRRTTGSRQPHLLRRRHLHRHDHAHRGTSCASTPRHVHGERRPHAAVPAVPAGRSRHRLPVPDRHHRGRDQRPAGHQPGAVRDLGGCADRREERLVLPDLARSRSRCRTRTCSASTATACATPAPDPFRSDCQQIGAASGHAVRPVRRTVCDSHAAPRTSRVPIPTHTRAAPRTATKARRTYFTNVVGRLQLGQGQLLAPRPTRWLHLLQSRGAAERERRSTSARPPSAGASPRRPR